MLTEQDWRDEAAMARSVLPRCRKCTTRIPRIAGTPYFDDECPFCGAGKPFLFPNEIAEHREYG